MKKIFLFAILGVLVLASCKKSSSSAPVTTTNTITATIDGTTYVYTHGLYIDPYNSYTGPDGIWGYYAAAYDSSHTNGLGIDAEQIGKLLSTKIYGELGDTTTHGQVFYYSDVNTWFSITRLNPATVTILSNTNGTIQGTFQGTVYYNGDSTSSDKKVITNGKFNISVL